MRNGDMAYCVLLWRRALLFGPREVDSWRRKVPTSGAARPFSPRSSPSSSPSSIQPLATHAASQLPPLTPHQLSRCLRHRRDTPLSHCVHLNNPATGSTSLSSAFAQLTELQNLTFPNGKSRKRKDVFHSERSLSGFNLMVSHALDVSSVQLLLHNKRLPPAACFVLSLRNPATRLISAFRDSFQHNERLAGSIANKRQNRSASLMIDKLRHPFAYSEWLLPPRYS